MIAALLLVASIAAPTPSPSLSPLPVAQVNYYAVQGAQASGLDPTLVRAVIDHESAGDPHAVSDAGAVGLMQLEPSTASDCGISNRYNALSNAICGSKTLQYLISDYGIQRGIAAYNFGAGNVASGKPWPQETKNYVASVISEYDRLQHDGVLQTATPPSPSPTPVITPNTPVFDRIGRINFGGIFGRSDDPCPNRGVAPVLGAAQVADSLVTANAIRHGSIGIRIFGSASPLGFLAETLLTDIIFHRLTHHSCALRTAGDLLLTGAAINNAAQVGFPK